MCTLYRYTSEAWSITRPYISSHWSYFNWCTLDYKFHSFKLKFNHGWTADQICFPENCLRFLPAPEESPSETSPSILQWSAINFRGILEDPWSTSDKKSLIIDTSGESSRVWRDSIAWMEPEVLRESQSLSEHLEERIQNWLKLPAVEWCKNSQAS